MVSRFALGVLLALLSPFFVTAPVAAGNWAVTTLDELPAEGMRAGETYQVGYTIRQHGVTPLRGAKTEIRARSATSGETVTFRAAESNVPGHYLAEVRFPSEGTWSWEVLQGPFGVQPLGVVDVRPAVTQPARPEPNGLSAGWLAVGAGVAVLAAISAAVLAGIGGRRASRAPIARVAGGSQ